MSSTFFVPGIPVPKGSAKAFVVGGRAIVTQTNRDKQRPWSASIGLKAEEAGVKLHSGPVQIICSFLFPRPKAHYRGKAQTLREDAPRLHIKKPDIDKLVRCVLDALTGIAWVDDSQVQLGFCRKGYIINHEQPGVMIHLERMEETGP